MKKRYIALIALVMILVAPYLLLNMRKSDRGAVSEFHSEGIRLMPHMLHIGLHHLHYISIGSDTMPTLVFVHGSPGSWHAFSEYLKDPSLRSKYRLISIDRPGFGYSDFGDAMHMVPQAEVIGSFIDSIRNSKPLYLIGHSLGGTIVPLVAAVHPADITGIVLLAGALDVATEPTEAWRAHFIDAPMRWLLPGAIRPSNDEQYYYKTDMYHFKDLVPLIRCRVYLLHAADDDIVDVANVAYMKRAFTAAVVSDTIFSDGKHFIPWNHREYVTKLLMEL